MSATAQAITLSLLLLATSIWIGGYVAIAVVARTAANELDPVVRVAFFRDLGRRYFWVGTPALLVSLALGLALARGRTDSALFSAGAVVAAVLVISFAIAVGQARRMTRLREALAATPADPRVREQVTHGARAAGILRGLLGVLTLTLLVLGSFLTFSR